MKRLKVNIVDDHRVITDGLRLLLDNHPQIEINNVAHTGEMALSQLVEATPDIVLMDYSLSTSVDPTALNGLQAAEHILARYPGIKIMMLTMHDSANVIVPCITLGVHGYMLKSERNTDVASAILHLDSYGFYFSPSIAKDLAVNIRNHHQNAITLSTREQEVLESLFKGASTKEIADQLYISAHTVETHRKNLIHKFEAKNSIHLIYLALQKGVLSI
jgi:DNA-binding NarL/FixJ family response regulator